MKKLTKNKSLLMIIIGALLFLGGLTGFIMTLRASLASGNVLSGKKVIILGDRDGVPGEAISAVIQGSGADVIYSSTECFVCTASGAMDLQNQQRIKDAAETYGPENVVVVLGQAEGEAAGLYAETVTAGDPTFAGPLTNVALGLQVYHVFEEQIKELNPEVYSEQVEMTEMALDVDDIISETQAVREEYCQYCDESPQQATTATFATGKNVNSKMKTLAADDGQLWNWSATDSKIHVIRRGGSLPTGFEPNSHNTVSSSTSDNPIYIWWDSTTSTIYYYSEASTIYLNSDSESMFEGFNSLESIPGASDWDTSNVTTMAGVFDSCMNLTNINGLSNWDTSNVTNMRGMFFGCASLENIGALSNWDTSSVTDMSGIFCSCENLTSVNALSNWDTSSVTDIRNMFRHCSKASGTIQILGNPTDFSDAFDGAATDSGAQITVNYRCGITTNIDAIIATKSNNSNVQKSGQCGNGSATFDTGKNVNAKMKTLANGTTKAYHDSDTAIQAIKRGGSLPSGFTPSAENTVSSSTSDNPIYIWWDNDTHTIYYYSEAEDVYLNPDSSYMFYDMQSLTDISGLSEVDTSNVTNMGNIFDKCANLSNIGAIANWDTSNVTSMRFAFDGCTSLTNIDSLNNWDISSVTNMWYMFKGCTSLANINGASNWDVSNVKNMGFMFEDCTNLANIDGASNWDTSSVTNIYYIFSNCPKVSGTFPILGNPKYYDNAFTGAATAPGAELTINYSSDTTNIDNILATASSDSNVKKGENVTSKHTITTSVEHGTITATSEVYEGDDKTISYSPDEGYMLKSITVDGESEDIDVYPNSYTFNDVYDDHSIAVVYEEIPKIGYIVNYLEEDTEKVLHAQKVDTEAKLGTYIIAGNEEIAIDNYHCVRHSTESLEIGPTRADNVITLYYQEDSKEVSIDHNIKLTSDKTKITSENDKVDYKIKYRAILENYTGDAEIEIVAYLPYQVDTTKSDLAGGTYSKEYRTITWKGTVDVTSTNNQIDFEKSISLVYKGYDLSKKNLTNIAVGNITLKDLDDYREEVYDTKTISVDIKKKEEKKENKNSGSKTNTNTNSIVRDRVNSPNTTTRNMYLYIIIMMISLGCFIFGFKSYKQLKS